MSKVREHGFRGQVTNSYEPEDGEKIIHPSVITWNPNMT